MHYILFTIKYKLLRPALSNVCYFLKNLWSDGKDSAPYNVGITFCLVVKNEDLTISSVLDNLLGFVDQIICVDNGSEDGTYSRLCSFKQGNQDQIEVIIIYKPEYTLAQCRQECMKYVKYQYFIRGDGDMLFTSEYKNYVKRLLRRATQRPICLLTSKIELFGDQNSYKRMSPPISRGEYFFRSVDKSVNFKEYGGRLEHARIPLHYKLIDPNIIGFIHLDYLKTNERLIYRSIYLDYREFSNRNNKTFVSFNDFSNAWIFMIFASSIATSVRFRMARLIASFTTVHTTSFVINKLRDLDRTKLPVSPFVIVYKDGYPYIRVDNRDKFYMEYVPTDDDLKWEPSPERFVSRHSRDFLVKLINYLD